MKSRLIGGGLLAAAIAAASFTAFANHSWGNYHWGRTTSSFVLQTLDSTVTTSYVNWPSKLQTAAGQWSQSTKFDLSVSPYANDSTSRKKCTAVAGKIRVCNASYGRNGWLGLASININGDHITQGTAKMNDSYTSTWAGDPNEAAHVMCQEVGHTFGLGHTSEDGSTQNTCMDYSSSPTSTAPNQHDYDQLVTIYSHLDSVNTYSTSLASVATASQRSMAGQNPLGVRIHKGVFNETWAAPDGRGGVWIHHVTLAPGSENTDLLH